MSGDLLERLVEQGALEPLDRQLALRSLQRCGSLPEQEPAWALGTALAMAAIRDGHTCLEIGPDFPKTPGEWLAARDATDVSRDADLPGWPDPAGWADALSRCPLVRVLPSGGKVPGGRDERRLFVLDRRRDRPRLYLERYWDAEQRLISQVSRRMSREEGGAPAWTAEDLAALREDLEFLLPVERPEDRQGVLDQRLALVQSLLRPFLVLTGGPGTGKTSTIVSLLALHLRDAVRRGQSGEPPLRVAVLAPTGKAAARIVESIQKGLERMRKRIESGTPAAADWDRVMAWIPKEAATVHRALGYYPETGTFLHGPDNPLPVDIAVVDEASMLDAMLSVRLVDALPDSCRVLWVGDRDQLVSVQAGAVLAGLCRSGRSLRIGLSDQICRQVREVLGDGVARLDEGLPVPAPMADALAVLRYSFRTRKADMLAEAVRVIQDLDDCRDPAETAARCRQWTEGLPTEDRPFAEPGEAVPGIRFLASEDRPMPSQEVPQRSAGRLPGLSEELVDRMVRRWRAVLDEAVSSVQRARSLEEYQKAVREALQALGRFTVLCTHRQGPRGSEACTEAILKRWDGVMKETSRFFVGQPLMVLANDYSQNLFNGDTGIVLPPFEGEEGDLVACFRHLGEAGFRMVTPSRIGEVATAFAVTVHKAQGSEFDEVLLVTPREEDPFLTRELIYTAITRAREAVEVAGPRTVFADALTRRTQRHSGLLDAFWPDG